MKHETQRFITNLKSLLGIILFISSDTIASLLTNIHPLFVQYKPAITLSIIIIACLLTIFLLIKDKTKKSGIILMITILAIWLMLSIDDLMKGNIVISRTILVSILLITLLQYKVVNKTDNTDRYDSEVLKMILGNIMFILPIILLYFNNTYTDIIALLLLAINFKNTNTFLFKGMLVLLLINIILSFITFTGSNRIVLILLYILLVCGLEEN